MHPLHVMLLVSCLASAVFGTSVLMRDARETANRLASAIIFGGAFWALCELLWLQSADAESALRLVRLSALGWVGIGPLGLHLMMELTADRSPVRRRLLRVIYGFSAAYLLVCWTTSLVHARVVRVPWGWTYEFGPLYPLFYVITVSSLFLGLGLAYRAYRTWPSPAERRQARGIGAGILLPLCIASVTDGVLPFLKVHVWHLGAASVSLLGASVAWTFYRYGYSLLAPGTFAQEILEAMSDGLALLHLDGRVRRANPALLRMAGAYHLDELAGRCIGDLIEGLDISDDGSDAAREWRLTPLSGPSIMVAVTSSLLVDRQGAPTGRVVIVRDLEEVVDLRQRIVVSGRMAAVGQLAAGVAHELNNPMAYVRANLSLLQQHVSKLGHEPLERIPSGDTLLAECDELITESLEGIDRATGIIRDIKGFSHSGNAAREFVDPRNLIEATLRMATPQIGHRARVEAELDPCAEVECSPREIQQVLLNLLINAADAIEERHAPDRGCIRVTTRLEDDHLCIDVEDDGCGIDPLVQERMFDPFFTTKPEGLGTGLGLSLSYEMLRRHGGDLQVETEPGRGSRFSIMLPR